MTIKLTMAQALLKFLDQQYVSIDGEDHKYVDSMFGIFGHGCVLGVGQGLQEPGQSIKFYQGHNEQNMAHAAIGYAKQKNRLGIIPCVSSIGPGALNMVTAAGTATANRIPLLLLPGDTFADRQPDPVLQQIEQEYNVGITANDSFKAVSKYFDRINRPEQLISAMMNAMRTLTSFSDTGAVTIALPQDVQTESYDYPRWFFDKRVWYMDRPIPSDRSIKEAAEKIKEAKKPLIVVGGGVRYSLAGEALKDFAEQFNIPMGETQAGKGLLPWNHELMLGGIGVTGSKAANEIAKEADLILAVGTRLGDFTTGSKGLFKESANIITLNVNTFDSIKMNATAIVGDAKLGLETLGKELQDYKSSYTDEIVKAKEEWDSIVDALYNHKPGYGFSQTRALGIINETIAKDAIVVGSSGSLPGDLQRVWRPSTPETYHVEYGFSCMGYEVNGALGVKMAAPTQEVYTMCGDGSYLMGHSELFTAIQEGIKINIILMDNHGWGCIENLQNNQGSESFGTVFRYRDEKTDQLSGDYVPIDFAMNAQSLGAKTYKIYNEQELLAALEDSKTQTRACLFDIKVLPKTMTEGYSSWWRVGVSEVTANDNVQKKYDEMKEAVKQTRKY
ncbi:3D-(3,5/4)-trihydroxycyclohexane-1,2-dione acylhydrolase (decyclizing) [Erysipelothrix urinaevulpis]|uniref:3D-(3,5/4)-trihydroxycyclohexane-1,2-dione acylhydrolase (decyclizing) n=1 Tax=Erysipelothrix urinaevulpis TaxID=2683717 RepID=UPI00135C97EF|nr:3D-(3,5/4)-trihydroxycyclohexane-1,2-dione acylhydrolase (decyclizing) [Erysipelothrix urinaevulpis]